MVWQTSATFPGLLYSMQSSLNSCKLKVKVYIQIMQGVFYFCFVLVCVIFLGRRQEKLNIILMKQRLISTQVVCGGRAYVNRAYVLRVVWSACLPCIYGWIYKINFKVILITVLYRERSCSRMEIASAASCSNNSKVSALSVPIVHFAQPGFELSFAGCPRTMASYIVEGILSIIVAYVFATLVTRGQDGHCWRIQRSHQWTALSAGCGVTMAR